MMRLSENLVNMGFKGYAAAVLQPAVLFEGLCLSLGWAFIFSAPGLAALRCFRVFRLLWIFDLYFGSGSLNILFFGDFLGRNCELCLRYFKRLGAELASSESRGAIVILVVFFYVTYILAVVLWNEKPSFTYYDPVEHNNATADPYALSIDSHCITLRACFVNLLRLSFYDGDGFDLLAAILYSGSSSLPSPPPPLSLASVFLFCRVILFALFSQ